MSPHHFRAHPPSFFSVVVLVPLDRVGSIPWYGHLLAAAAAFTSAALRDVFTGMLFLLVASSAIDYWLARRVARLQHTFTPDLARAGAYSKIGGILLLLLVRLFELYLGRHGIVDSRGMISTALAMGLFVVDLESVEHHRQQLGARPIPFLAQALSLLRSIPRRILTPAGPSPRSSRSSTP